MVSQNIKTRTDDYIEKNGVMVFSKSYCPYCRATKQLLQQKGAKFEVIELDKDSEGSDIQDYLESKTGQRTVPNVFIDKEHIGGNSELSGRGDLDELLQKAGAV